jgi:hypothetical protein
MEFGVTEQLTPCATGAVQESETVPLNPFTALAPTLKLTDPPGATVVLLMGETATAKSAAPLNVAPTVVSVFIVTEQAAVPVHAVSQPPKVEVPLTA